MANPLLYTKQAHNKERKFMSSTINKVAAFDKVIRDCNTLGVRYNPSNVALQPSALATLLEQAQQKAKAVNDARMAHILAVSARKESLVGIPKLVVRITRLLSAAGVTKEQKEDAKMIKRLFFPGTGKKTSVVKAETSADSPVKGTRSSYGRGSAYLVDRFQLLVNLLQSIPAYKPNDSEFQVAQLNARLAEFQALNLAVVQTKSNLNAARIERNKVIYGAGGVVEVTRLTKDFIRGKFGFSSEELKHAKS
jgi:hypothetical protein